MNAAGMEDAGHPETDPDAETQLFILASCPVDYRPDGAPRLWGKLKIRISQGSLAHSIYQRQEVEEPFNCDYEMNPDFREELEAGGLKVSGLTDEGGIRIIELPGHRFYMATGFVPQLNSEENSPHPLITAFIKAAIPEV